MGVSGIESTDKISSSDESISSDHRESQSQTNEESNVIKCKHDGRRHSLSGTRELSRHLLSFDDESSNCDEPDIRRKTLDDVKVDLTVMKKHEQSMRRSLSFVEGSQKEGQGRYLKG